MVVSKEHYVGIGSSSKGNQTKFYNNGVWVKIDTHGYEGLAEEFSSLVESCIEGVAFVPYYTDLIEVAGSRTYRGCYSYSMFDECRFSFQTLRSILRGGGIPLSIFKKSDIKDSFISVVSSVRSLTGIDIGSYLARTIYLDSLILNEDRHPMNLGLVHDKVTGVYYEAPIFDNGISFLSFEKQYNRNKSLEDNIKMAESKPFSKFYERQVDLVRCLGYPLLRVNKAAVGGIIKNYSSSIYSEEYVIRVKKILLYNLDRFEGRSFVYV